MYRYLQVHTYKQTVILTILYMHARIVIRSDSRNVGELMDFVVPIETESYSNAVYDSRSELGN